MSFSKGDYVRMVIAPRTRLGRLVTDADDQGRFMFKLDPRIGDDSPSPVYGDEIEHCNRPSDSEMSAMKAMMKH
jgi:hypothetical protein